MNMEVPGASRSCDKGPNHNHAQSSALSGCPAARRKATEHDLRCLYAENGVRPTRMESREGARLVDESANRH